MSSLGLKAIYNRCLSDIYFSYGTRVWGPLIGSPQIIFEIDVPCHVEPCLDILRHVFVESWTQTPHKVSKVKYDKHFITLTFYNTINWHKPNTLQCNKLT